MANIFLCSYFAEVASKIDEVVNFQGKDIVFIDTAAKFEEVNFYVGESAGAIAAAPDTKYATLMDENSVKTSDFTGLNLVDFCVVPHFGCEPFTQATHEIMEKFGNLYDLRPMNNAEFIAL